MSTRITATACRKAAKKLGPDHPAVKAWQRVASRRVANQNNADATQHDVANPAFLIDELEAAKAKLIEAATA